LLFQKLAKKITRIEEPKGRRLKKFSFLFFKTAEDKREAMQALASRQDLVVELPKGQLKKVKIRYCTVIKKYI